MNDMLKAVLPTIVDLAAKISNSMICVITDNNRYFPIESDQDIETLCIDNTLLEYIEVYWAKIGAKSLIEFRLKLSADHILYNVADFKYERIDWADPQCLDKITKILTDSSSQNM